MNYSCGESGHAHSHGLVRKEERSDRSAGGASKKKTKSSKGYSGSGGGGFRSGGTGDGSVWGGIAVIVAFILFVGPGEAWETMTSPPGGRPPAGFGPQAGDLSGSWLVGKWAQNCAVRPSRGNQTYEFRPNGRLRITPVDVNTPTNYWWKLSGQTLTLGNRDGSTRYGIERGESWFGMTMDGGRAILYDCAVDGNLYTASPSFQCAGDLSWVEKTICNDEGLAAQDRRLASLREGMAESDAARRINGHWREEWDRCGGSGSLQGCLGWVYREWIGALQGLEPEVEAQALSTASATSPSSNADASRASPRSGAARPVRDRTPADLEPVPGGRAGSPQTPVEPESEPAKGSCIWFNERPVCSE